MGNQDEGNYASECLLLLAPLLPQIDAGDTNNKLIRRPRLPPRSGVRGKKTPGAERRSPVPISQSTRPPRPKTPPEPLALPRKLTTMPPPLPDFSQMDPATAAAVRAEIAAQMAAVEKFNVEAFTLLAIAIVVTGLRTYARVTAVGWRRLQADDYLVLVGAVRLNAKHTKNPRCPLGLTKDKKRRSTPSKRRWRTALAT